MDIAPWGLIRILSEKNVISFSVYFLGLFIFNSRGRRRLACLFAKVFLGARSVLPYSDSANSGREKPNLSQLTNWSC